MTTHASRRHPDLSHLIRICTCLGASWAEKEPDMTDNELVLAFFKSEADADAAVVSLKEWDKRTGEVKLGAIGVLVADENGQIKEHKLGARSGKKGAGVGLVLAVIAPPTLLAGMVGGGILGHFHHKGLGLSDADRQRIAARVTGGEAAVGVLVPAGQASIVSARFDFLGAESDVHNVSDEALEAVAAAAPEIEAEPAAAQSAEAEAVPEIEAEPQAEAERAIPSEDTSESEGETEPKVATVTA
jgi:hypothetical protein